MANLIRCVEGHIFDSERGTCPVCGWTVPAATAAAGEPVVDATPALGTTAAPLNANGLPRSALFAALGAVSAAAVGIAIFFVVVKPKPAPAPPAPAPAPAIAKGEPAKPAATNAKGDNPATPSAGQHEHHTASSDTPAAPQTPDKPPANTGAPQQVAKADPAPNAVAPAPQPAPPKQVSKNLADELTEWGIPQQLTLQRTVGSYTPTTLPGARRITTDELRQLGDQAVLIDVLDEGGNHVTIPHAVHIPGAGNFGGGRFDDRLQRNFSNVLAQLTNRNLDRTLVFFCECAQCWES